MAGYADMGAGLGDAIGSLMAEMSNASSREEAEAIRQKAMALYNIELPNFEDVKSQAATAGNPAAQASRMSALKMLQERGQEGYNVEDRAAISDTMSDVNQAARGRQQAITQQMDPNSGAAVAAQLSNAQNATQVANKHGMDIAAGSRRQALQALSQQGKLAGDIDDSAFRRGQAGDAISMFNERNKGQNFANQLEIADRRSGQLGAQRNDITEEMKRKGRVYAGVGKAVGSAAGTYFGS
jgi:hypothetical protein